MRTPARAEVHVSFDLARVAEAAVRARGFELSNAAELELTPGTARHLILTRASQKPGGAR